MLATVRSIGNLVTSTVAGIFWFAVSATAAFYFTV